MGRRKLHRDSQVRLSEDEKDLVIILRACRISPIELLQEAGAKMPLLAAAYSTRRLTRDNEQQGQAESQSDEVGKEEGGIPEEHSGDGKEKPTTAGRSVEGGFAEV